MKKDKKKCSFVRLEGPRNKSLSPCTDGTDNDFKTDFKRRKQSTCGNDIDKRNDLISFT